MGDDHQRAKTRVRQAASVALVAAGLAAAPAAHAFDLGGEGDPLGLQVHAFASQGFIATTHGVNYLDTDSSKGSFQLSEVGINFTKSIGDRLRVGIQLFAQDLGPNGNYDAKIDWFYLDYRFADWLGVRAGRVKIPFGLYNELNDIDSARVPVLLPQSLYPLENSSFLLAQTGAEVYGYLRMGALGALEYRLYGGTIFIDNSAVTSSVYTSESVTVPYLGGGRLMWETPVDGLRLGGSVQGIKIDTVLTAGMTPIDVNIEAILSVASIEYAAHDWLLAAEYSQWSAKSQTSIPMVPATQVTSERAYAMASYRVARWLQPGVYYSLLFPDNTKRGDGRENVQHDLATTLRFDITPNWLLKLEGHYMVGTAGLDSTLNDNVSAGALNQAWAVFLAKTTAYF